MPKVEDISSELNGAKYFQHWSYEQDTTISLWMNPQSLRLHSPHQVQIYQSTFWTFTCTRILPGTHDQSIERCQLHICLSG